MRFSGFCVKTRRFLAWHEKAPYPTGPTGRPEAPGLGRVGVLWVPPLQGGGQGKPVPGALPRAVTFGPVGAIRTRPALRRLRHFLVHSRHFPRNSGKPASRQAGEAGKRGSGEAGKRGSGEAGSGKREAGSGKREAGSGERGARPGVPLESGYEEWNEAPTGPKVTARGETPGPALRNGEP